MRTTDAQVRKLMEEMTKHGQVGRAAAKADMDRKTARKYIRDGSLPSEQVQPRTWRTRENPFSPEDWASITARLEETPELEAKTLFAWLSERRPDVYTPGQLRTLQRLVKRWRAAHGPDREVFFAQQHRPGEAAQTDFTGVTELGVTIAGQIFAHMLCVVVLPFSNWQWATVCLSESIMAMRRGVQAALFQLGRVPLFLGAVPARKHRHRRDKRLLGHEQRRCGDGADRRRHASHARRAVGVPLVLPDRSHRGERGERLLVHRCPVLRRQLHAGAEHSGGGAPIAGGTRTTLVSTGSLE